jgi:hypothetical protein
MAARPEKYTTKSEIDTEESDNRSLKYFLLALPSKGVAGGKRVASRYTEEP